MLYTFKSKAGADVLMLGEAGDAVLRLMGREPAPRGILQCGDLPALLQALDAGIAADEAEFQRQVAEATAAGEPAPVRAGVGLRQRAWPLRELMTVSHRDGADVVWGV
ncbi:DUF1840 domain-containing protein [Roseateles sp. DC23W]|uniref:DUF1840 domain-containing protein n=1 Tax=Pelomonas dachongensis TaxID=3299029 RepID=A0ABW7EQT6_9BURK